MAKTFRGKLSTVLKAHFEIFLKIYFDGRFQKVLSLIRNLREKKSTVFWKLLGKIFVRVCIVASKW